MVGWLLAGRLVGRRSLLLAHVAMAGVLAAPSVRFRMLTALESTHSRGDEPGSARVKSWPFTTRPA